MQSLSILIYEVTGTNFQNNNDDQDAFTQIE